MRIAVDTIRLPNNNVKKNG